MPDTASGRVFGRYPALFLALFGALMASGLAPLGSGPVAFGALMLALWLGAKPAAPRRAALRGWAFGAGYFAVGLHWIVEPFFVDAATTGWLAPFGLVGLAGGLGLFWALAFWAAARLGGGLWRLAILLAVVETARGFVLTGFPWALIGHIWSKTTVLNLSAVTGPYGLTLLTLLLAALPVWAWQRQRRPGIALALAFGGWAALLATGQWMAGGAPDTRAEAPVIRLVQPNAPQHEKWDPDRIPFFFNRMVSYSQADPRPDLVVWPESALPMLLEDATPALQYIAGEARAPLVIGIQRRDETSATRFYNALVVTDARGAVHEVYDKHHLVPFGEYMPVPAFWRALGIETLAARTRFGYVPGPGPDIVEMPGIGRALPLICYEAVFARHASTSGERPDMLLQVTNDAWFGAAVGPWQHLEQARMRAIEQGLPMVRVANTGVSAMIDAKGRITGALPLNAPGYLDVALPAPLPPTLYAQTGNLPVIVLLGMLFLTIALPLRRYSH